MHRSLKTFKVILFLSVLFLFQTASVYGKKKIPGYYITNSNDTVSCEFLVGFDLFEKIRILPLQYKIECIDSSGIKHKFKPGDVKGFLITVDTVSYSFVPIRNTMHVERAFHTDSIIFANILVDGYVKLYEIFFEKSGGSMPGPNGTMTPTGGGVGSIYYLEKGRSEPDGVRRLFFRKDISRILYDNQKLVDKINNKEYKYSDTKEIVAEYNAWKR
ncbi:MAG TPA: hypothetical protein VJY62_20600 [Bacteroidia bacterium]|nr:hypothetical protein [Bacteroidia bacterium]